MHVQVNGYTLNTLYSYTLRHNYEHIYNRQKIYPLNELKRQNGMHLDYSNLTTSMITFLNGFSVKNEGWRLIRFIRFTLVK